MDVLEKEKKVEYEMKVIELLIGRYFPVADISDIRKKHTIMEEAAVYYRDHIHGDIGSDASHHNVKQRFPNLPDTFRVELSAFAEKILAAGEDINKIQKIIQEYGINMDFYADKLKTLLHMQSMQK